MHSVWVVLSLFGHNGASSQILPKGSAVVDRLSMSDRATPATASNAWLPEQAQGRGRRLTMYSLEGRSRLAQPASDISLMLSESGWRRMLEAQETEQFQPCSLRTGVVRTVMGQTSDALQTLSETEDTLALMAQFDANLTAQGMPLYCQAGYECVPLNREDLALGGVCLRCSLGQYCPYNTSNPASRLDYNVCPRGFSCSDPSDQKPCPAGNTCNFGDFNDGLPCPSRLTTRTPWLTWGQVLYCPEGTASLIMEENICAAGFTCPNTSQRIICPAGYFCAAGANETKQCSRSVFGYTSAEDRCLAGSAFEPAQSGLIYILIIALLVLVLIMEILSCIETMHRGAPVMADASSSWSRKGLGRSKFGSISLPEVSITRSSRTRLLTRLRFTREEGQGAVSPPMGASRSTQNGVRQRCSSVSTLAFVEEHNLVKNSHGHVVGYRSSTAPPSPPPSPPQLPRSGTRFTAETPHVATRLKLGWSAARQNNASAEYSAYFAAKVDHLDSRVRSKRRGMALLKLELDGLCFDIGEASVLKEIKAMLLHGELVALLGESGSGKTTLLNVLGGRANYGWTSGKILLNSRPYQPSSIRHKIGYVPQAHLVFKELTVYENLLYAARLRLVGRLGDKERKQLVDDAIDLLGLKECQHFVCDPAIGERLSGGQLRRVGIGVELVCDPPIMLLDEPTSALDAVNTRLVVAALKDLTTKRGVLVVASLHQPRHAVYEMLDRLLLLRKGELIYGGTKGRAVQYFSDLGYKLPPQSNPADFFVEVAFGFERTFAPPSGLIWKRIEYGQRWRRSKEKSSRPPSGGEELSNQRLAAALQRQTGNFTQDECCFSQEQWEEFGINDVHRRNFIRSGDWVFEPVELGAAKPNHGAELHNQGLASALIVDTDEMGKKYFTQHEWAQLCVTCVRVDNYVRCRDAYFMPYPPPSGLLWECVGRRKPHAGIELRDTKDSKVLELQRSLWDECSALAPSGRQRSQSLESIYVAFTKDQWKAFKIDHLDYNHFVSYNDHFFTPVLQLNAVPARGRYDRELPPCIGLERLAQRDETWQAYQVELSKAGNPGRKRYESYENSTTMISASILAVLWRHWLCTACRSSETLMRLLDNSQSEDRRRACAVGRVADAVRQREQQNGAQLCEAGGALRRKRNGPLTRLSCAVMRTTTMRSATPLNPSRGDNLSAPSRTGQETAPRACMTVDRRAARLDRWMQEDGPWTADGAPRASVDIQQVNTICLSAQASPVPTLRCTEDARSEASPLDLRTQFDSITMTPTQRKPDPVEHSSAATPVSSPRSSAIRIQTEIDEPALETAISRSPFTPNCAPMQDGASEADARPRGDRTLPRHLPRGTADDSIVPSLSMSQLAGTSAQSDGLQLAQPVDTMPTPRTPRRSMANLLISSRKTAKPNRRSTLTKEEGQASEPLFVSQERFVDWFQAADGFGGILAGELGCNVWAKAAHDSYKPYANINKRSRWQLLLDFSPYIQPTMSGWQMWPSYAQLRTAMREWDPGWSTRFANERPSWMAQFMVCLVRYSYKCLRTRMRIYMLLIVTACLGALCGALHGNDPDPNSVMTFFLLFNTMFGSICATSNIGTFGGGPEAMEFFRHEAFSGVSQTAEGLARLVVDVVPLVLLAPVFATAIQAFGALHFDIIVPWMAFSWALSPLGYIFTLVAPGNATVLTTSVTFVICAFLNGFFGVKMSMVPTHSQWLLELSPGHSIFRLIAMSSILAEPFSTKRWALIRQLWYTQMIPQSKEDVLKFELEQIAWRRDALVNLLVAGLVLRAIVVLLFYCRSNIVLAGAAKHFRSTLWLMLSKVLRRKLSEIGYPRMEGQIPLISASHSSSASSIPRGRASSVSGCSTCNQPDEASRTTVFAVPNRRQRATSTPCRSAEYAATISSPNQRVTIATPDESPSALRPSQRISHHGSSFI